MSRHCVRCRQDLTHVTATGEPAIYQTPRNYTLCEPCFFDEDMEIEKKGGNNLPDTLATYHANYKKFG
jgi:hypothetical protein